MSKGVSRPLGDRALAWEGEPTESSLVLDRRGSERYTCRPGVSGHLAVAKQGRLYISRIHNVSDRGVGLTSPRPVDPGTVTALSFQDLARGVYHSALTRVVAAAEDGKGNWILHCTFARALPPDVLRALVGEEP